MSEMYLGCVTCKNCIGPTKGHQVRYERIQCVAWKQFSFGAKFKISRKINPPLTEFVGQS